MNTTPADMLSASVTISPLTIPASIDAPDAADFLAMVQVRNEIYRTINGNEDETMAPAELLPHYDEDPDEIRLAWIIRDGETVIGRAGLDVVTEANSHIGYWLVEILREHEGRGIGSAAYEIVEQTAREHGRRVLQSWAEHPDAPGPRLAAPTGFGDIPHDRPARFYQRHGYSLEQIERKSTFDMTAPMDRVEELFEQAKAASAGYRLVQWTLPTPPEFVEGFAWAKSRMSTDAPAANMEFDEQVWDAERVARNDQRYLDAGNLVLVTAAVHEESGRVAAFNELVRPVDPGMTSNQHDTLVLKEHRGHRLGMLVKCAGLLSWREHAPLSPKVMTYNAEENRPMLDINEALGFVPVSYCGAWKKVLA